MQDLIDIALGLSIASPFFCALLTGLLLLARKNRLAEPTVYRICSIGLLMSLAGSVTVFFQHRQSGAGIFTA